MAIQDFKFEKLDVYQRARILVRKIYQLTDGWSRDYLYDLSSQLRRAVLSILLNIAEGSGRSRGEFSRFLTIAEGSCRECVAVLDVAIDLDLISTDVRDSTKREITEIVMMLEGLKKSLK